MFETGFKFHQKNGVIQQPIRKNSSIHSQYVALEHGGTPAACLVIRTQVRVLIHACMFMVYRIPL